MDALLLETLSCSIGYLRYILTAVAALLVINALLKPDREVFRKILHTVAYSSSAAFVASTGDWRAASLASAAFAIIVYPALSLGEHWSGYGRFFNQRSTGEVKHSLLELFFAFSAINAFTWGLLGSPWLGVCAILMWGPGDAAAALIGRRFGRHKIHLPHADSHKSWEGSFAMAATSLVIGVICLTLGGVFPFPAALLASLLTAPIAAYTELITKNGNDTVTVPVVNALLLGLLYLFL